MAALYVVGTPIGNLKDITYRAVEVLRDADIIFCEDTRRSLTLLLHYGVKKPLKSYHKFNEREVAAEIADAVQGGRNAALITDAGMPCVSDPGAAAVREAARRGLAVEVIGGVTAFTHALIKSGMSASAPAGAFYFAGFLPAKPAARRAALSALKSVAAPLIFYCAPHDLKKDLADLYAAFGARAVCAARELTKLHEEFVAFKLGEAYGKEPRGEYVLVVDGAGGEADAASELTPDAHLRRNIEAGLSVAEAVKLTARERGVPKNEIYKLTFRK